MQNPGPDTHPRPTAARTRHLPRTTLTSLSVGRRTSRRREQRAKLRRRCSILMRVGCHEPGQPTVRHAHFSRVFRPVFLANRARRPSGHTVCTPLEPKVPLGFRLSGPQCWSERGSPGPMQGGIHGGIKAREIHSSRRLALRVGLPSWAKTPEAQQSTHGCRKAQRRTDASMTNHFMLACALPATAQNAAPTTTNSSFQSATGPRRSAVHLLNGEST